MEKNEIFHDFRLICKMKAPISIKTSILTRLLVAQPNSWRVVGITDEALNIFMVNAFKYKPRMGINRSHIESRSDIYKIMLQTEYSSCDEWWNFHLENDKTILATSSENLKNTFSKIYPLDECLSLFKSNGFGWKHGKNEENFLRDLYRQKISS